MAESVAMAQLAQPSRRFVRFFERELESAVLHWHQPPGSQIAKNTRIASSGPMCIRRNDWKVCPDGQQGDFGRKRRPISLKPSK